MILRITTNQQNSLTDPSPPAPSVAHLSGPCTPDEDEGRVFTNSLGCRSRRGYEADNQGFPPAQVGYTRHFRRSQR